MRRAMRELSGTEPEIVNDEREKLVRVTFRLDADGSRGSGEVFGDSRDRGIPEVREGHG